MKRKFILEALFSALFNLAHGQLGKNDVLTLGTFHFAFHNKDVIKTGKDDQIDVLDKKYPIKIFSKIECSFRNLTA